MSAAPCMVGRSEVLPMITDTSGFAIILTLRLKTLDFDDDRMILQPSQPKTRRSCH
jgi:pimeloyl-ACP methyl ester carboxylesterase